MSRYRLNAPAINRVRRPGKIIDGAGLYLVRNGDGSVTPWQRVRGPKDRDVKVIPPHLGNVTTDWLLDVRRRAHALKTSTPVIGNGEAPPFSDLWARYTKAVKRWSARTRATYEARMQTYVAGKPLWDMPIDAVTVLDVEDAMREAREVRPLLAERVLLDIRGALAWAVSRSELKGNPANDYIASLRHLERRAKPKRYPALVKMEDLRRVIAAIEVSNLFGSLRHALILQAYTAQRSGSVVSARWNDFDLKARTWRIPREAMKDDDDERGDHVISLHPVLVKMLEKLPHRSQWVFASASNPKKHLDIGQLSHALLDLGFEGKHTPHGWRSALKTLADAAVGADGRPLFAHRWAEDVLDHVPPGVERNYSRQRAEDGMHRVLLWWGEKLSEAESKSR